MKPFVELNFLLVAVHLINGLSLRKEPVAFKPKVLQYANVDCDPSSIPVMDAFDIKKFSGDWYELAKSASGYIDVDDGMWKISSSNVSTQFLFSGRDNNKHCIRPIRGKIFPAKSPPGMLNLRYQTYTTHVDETIRVLFTDYESIAVIYTCMHHVHYEKEVCHAAGLLGAIWTRKPHVDVEVYNRAVKYLEMACVQKSTLTVRNLVGPCVVDDLGFRIDDFPVPDICYQPMDLGSCRGSLQRYYYDPKEKTCKIFMFGGCGGNLNNFMSLRECQERCLSAATKEPVCLSDAKCGIHCSPCCTEDRIGCVECNCEHIVVGKIIKILSSKLELLRLHFLYRSRSLQIILLKFV
ncbi:uncharacterized protein LOC118184126, partial [Stegodyphus dumicola]|uniref:uncharacterized protein LOC118184126 n=1 Tax=Stegodyphus dumicola TaxID=202533 RepID=UPI0015ABBF85